MALTLEPKAALDLWRRVTVANVREAGPDLSQRQMAVMTTIYLTDLPHTVRSLATALGVTKPVITRALTSLEKQGFVRRKADEEDRRNILIQRTVKGSVFLSEFSERVAHLAGAQA